jgi:hypothetical protein
MFVGPVYVWPHSSLTKQKNRLVTKKLTDRRAVVKSGMRKFTVYSIQRLSDTRHAQMAWEAG